MGGGGADFQKWVYKEVKIRLGAFGDANFCVIYDTQVFYTVFVISIFENT